MFKDNFYKSVLISFLLGFCTLTLRYFATFVTASKHSLSFGHSTVVFGPGWKGETLNESVLRIQNEAVSQAFHAL